MKILAVLSIVLAGFIASSFATQHYLSKSSNEINTQLTAIIEAVHAEDWPAARKHHAAASEMWHQTDRIWGLLTDHQEMDRIMEAFSRLDAYMETGSKVEAMAEIKMAKELITHIPEKESFNLVNIF